MEEQIEVEEKRLAQQPKWLLNTSAMIKNCLPGNMKPRLCIEYIRLIQGYLINDKKLPNGGTAERNIIFRVKSSGKRL